MGLGKKSATAKITKVTKTDMPVNQRNLIALVDSLNKDMKGLGTIGIGSNIAWLDPDRLRSGILGLDVLSAGGLPRRSLIQFWGVFSSAKTSSTILAMAAAQRQGHNVALGAAETFNKTWARDLGAWVQFSAGEFDQREQLADNATDWKAERAQMEEYNKGRAGLGQFVLALHPHGDGLLEIVAQIVKSNTCALVAVDSIAVCKPSALLDENEIGDDERGSGRQIQMLIRFMNRCVSAFSTRYNDDGEQEDGGDHYNETSVLCINQARQDRVDYGRGTKAEADAECRGIKT